MGHFINHPPPDSRPNVVTIPFDFLEGDDFPDHLRKHFPNVYFLPGTQPPGPTASRALVSGMVIVAARDLGMPPLGVWAPADSFSWLPDGTPPLPLAEDGEELLLDYHYSTQGADVPSWYRPTAGFPLSGE